MCNQMKGSPMITPLEITFHGLERSDAVEARIHEKFERLRSHFDRMTHARVVIDAPQRRLGLGARRMGQSARRLVGTTCR